MNRIAMLENISAQPASHRALLTLQRGNPAALRACAELIRKAPGRVIFTGMGGSLFATLAAVSRMTQGGHLVQAVESAEVLHYGRGFLGTPDVAVRISPPLRALHPLPPAAQIPAPPT